jgi:hypothetical protein
VRPQRLASAERLAPRQARHWEAPARTARSASHSAATASIASRPPAPVRDRGGSAASASACRRSASDRAADEAGAGSVARGGSGAGHERTTRHEQVIIDQALAVRHVASVQTTLSVQHTCCAAECNRAPRSAAGSAGGKKTPRFRRVCRRLVRACEEWRVPDSNRGHHDCQSDVRNTRTRAKGAATKRVLQRAL